MSAQIRLERAAYYGIFEQTQRGTLDITPWMDWFLACLGRSIASAQTSLAGVFNKTKFWESIQAVPLNERQRAMLNRLLDKFDGNLTTVNWAKLANCSHDTALRDIQDRVARGILVRGPGGGRGTSYQLRPRD